MRIRAIAIAALLLAASGCVTGSSGGAAAAAEIPGLMNASPLALQSETVRARRAELEAMAVAVPTRQQQIESLASALIVLADLYFDAAVRTDPKAAAIAPPRDRDEPAATGSQTETAGPPAREEAELAGLAPDARAYLLEADRARVEAVDRIELLLRDQRPVDATQLYAARARLYDDLGQRVAARQDWLYIVRSSGSPPELELEGWLVLTAWFTETGERVNAARAVAKANSAAYRIRDPARVAAVCALARRGRTITSSVCP